MLIARDSFGKRYVAKQFDPVRGGAEAWFYAEVGSDVSHAARYVGLVDGWLVVEHIEGPTALEIADQEHPGRVLDALAGTAEPLASLHKVRSIPEWAARSLLPSLDPVSVELWHLSSDAARHLIVLSQRHRTLMERYRLVRRETRKECLIHGDVKVDNVIRSRDGSFLIDWEESGAGLPAADIGAVAGSMICTWVGGLATEDGTGPVQWALRGALSVANVRATVRTFLARYKESAPLPPYDEIVGFTAAFIVARSWAESSLSSLLSPELIIRLRVAEHLLSEPQLVFGERQ